MGQIFDTIMMLLISSVWEDAANLIVILEDNILNKMDPCWKNV